MKSFARTALSLLLLLSVSLNSNAMDHHIEQPDTHHASSEEVDEQDEEKKSSSYLTQREVGSFFIGLGSGIIRRHPYAAILSFTTGAIALTNGPCNGLESVKTGFSTIRNAQSMNEAVPGAVEMAFGCASFSWSIISNGINIVHKQINQNN